MKWLRAHAVRLVVFVVFAVLALGLVPESLRGGNAILPRMSPILALLGALGARTWIGWGALLGVPLLVLAFFKGRIFCWKFCPMGFLVELAGSLNRRGQGRVRRVPDGINKGLLLVILVTAACGYPLLVWLDPLCIFNGFFAAWRAPLAVSTALTGLGFVTLLVLSACVPHVWCHKLCPLGGLQQIILELARKIRAGRTPAAETVRGAARMNMSRRAVLAAVPAVAAGLTARTKLGPNGAQAIRPPSADVARLNALCARCGNCMRACPYQLIHPDLGETGIDGLLSPVIHFRSQNAKWNPDDDRYCFQDCVKCTQVCPTGALHPLTPEEKKAHPIGLAVVDRAKCLAWAKNEYCAVCDEYCPYKAIELETQGDVSRPVVNPAKCWGCGACEGACPAEPAAIAVHPRPRV